MPSSSRTSRASFSRARTSVMLRRHIGGETFAIPLVQDDGV